MCSTAADSCNLVFFASKQAALIHTAYEVAAAIKKKQKRGKELAESKSLKRSLFEPDKNDENEKHDFSTSLCSPFYRQKEMATNRRFFSP